MNTKIYNSYLLIDLAKLRKNIQNIMNTLPVGIDLIPMLKCNAYGLGIDKVARVIEGFPKINTIALAQVREGLELRNLGIGLQLLITGAAFSPEQRRAAIENGLTLTVYTPGFASVLAAQARASGAKARVQLKINTGLNRLGIYPGAELDGLIQELRQSSDVLEITGTFSHFTEMERPDSPEIFEQFSLFKKALSQLESAGINPGKRHICASAGFEFHPEMALDAVRIGRRLYYDNPVRPDGLIDDTASWRAFITDIRFRRAGERLGYGEGYTLGHDSSVAMLGVGYGDGLMRELVRAHAPVLVNGQRAKLLSCCMDQCFLDVTGIDCEIGDEATLFGYDAYGNLLPGQFVAGLMNDEGCTLTSALGPRVKRIYK